MHALGYPQLFRVRLAAAVLPAGRRLLRDLQGAPGDHRLVEVRTAQRERPVPELHGALRIRADCGDGNHAFPEGVAPSPREFLGCVCELPPSGLTKVCRVLGRRQRLLYPSPEAGSRDAIPPISPARPGGPSTTSRASPEPWKNRRGGAG